MVLVPYNVSLSSASPLFNYLPFRNGDVGEGWHSAYTGVSSFEVDAPMGFSYRRTQAAAAQVSVSFFGTAIYLCISANGSPYSLTVDDTTYTTIGPGIDDSCDSYGADAVLIASGLKPKQHTAILSVSAKTGSEFQFFGATTTISVNSYSDSVWSKSISEEFPPWILSADHGNKTLQPDPSNAPGSENDSLTVNCVDESSSSASIGFTGAGGVLLRGTISNTSQLFSIEFDGHAVELDASSSWAEDDVVLFAQGSLDPHSYHKLTVRNATHRSQHSCNQPACCTFLDDLVLLMPGRVHLSNKISLMDSQAMFMPAAVGGAVGGFTAILILSIIAFCFIHRRRRRQRRAMAEFAAYSPHPYYHPSQFPPSPSNGSSTTPFLYSGHDTTLTAGAIKGSGTPSVAVIDGRGLLASEPLASDSTGRRRDLERLLAQLIRRVDSWRRGLPAREDSGDSLPSYRT